MQRGPGNTPNERCPSCGALYSLVGYRHLCRARSAPAARPVTKPTVTKQAVTKQRAGRPSIGDKPMPAAERVRRHRAALKARG
jgi:hypothetical protein